MNAMRHQHANRIAVIAGGPSAEYEISLLSGQAVQRELERTGKYESDLIVILRDRRWLFPTQERLDTASAVYRLQEEYDVVFLALHGPFGEDGNIQGLLEVSGIPYTGSRVSASAIAINKIKTKQLLAAAMRNGVFKLSPDLLVDKNAYSTNPRQVLDKIEEEVALPCVVKPNKQGSSYGVAIVTATSNLEDALSSALEIDTEVVVEKFIRGREITCGVFETASELMALPPTEIIPRVASFFDYKAKYSKGGSDEITPAEISPELIRRVQEVSCYCHGAIGCRGFSRTDMFVSDENDVYFLEINTIPGLTSMSLYPQELAAAGISWERFLDSMIELALKDARPNV